MNASEASLGFQPPEPHAYFSSDTEVSVGSRRDLLRGWHEHLGRDADFLALRGVRGHPAARVGLDE
jgi:hypothetical protein